MSRNLSIIIWSMLMQLSLPAQSKWGFENYQYLGRPGTGTVVPMMHLETRNKWYAGVRYNYEADQTISLFGGKTISRTGEVSLKWTPMLGVSAGQFVGFTLAMNADVEWRNFYFSSQTQQSIAAEASSEGFFFTWSELGYTISRHVFSGLALQYTLQASYQDVEPGIVAGVGFQHISFPFYIFSPFSNKRYFVLGLNYELNVKKRTRG